MADILDSYKPRDISDYTKNSINGDGVFDKMMQAAECHIQDEYKHNRITGSNYATVYMQVMNTIIQTASQFTLAQDTTLLELEKLKFEREKLKFEIEKLKAETDLAKANIKLAEAQLELERNKLPLLLAQIAAEQAKTRDVIDNGEEVREGETSNIHGLSRVQIDIHRKSIDTANKNEALTLAKELCVNPFSIIESSEGIGASFYGLNGGNVVSYLNEVRKAYGMTELNTTTYAGEHAKYKDKWAPGKSIAEDNDTDSSED